MRRAAPFAMKNYPLDLSAKNGQTCLSLLLLWLLGTPSRGHAQVRPRPASKSSQKSIDRVALSQSYGRLPLSFEANREQADPHVKLLSHGSGYSLFLTDSAAVLSLSRFTVSLGPEAHATDVICMELVGTSRHIRVNGAQLNAVASDPDQKARSQYIQLFKMPGQVAEAMFLKDDGLRLQGVFQGKVPEEQISINVQRLLEPGALTATLKWYRALDLDARIGPLGSPRFTFGEIKTWRSGVQRRRRQNAMSTVIIVLKCCLDTRIGYRTRQRKRSENS
jgi:hypothetical protein